MGRAFRNQFAAHSYDAFLMLEKRGAGGAEGGQARERPSSAPPR
jgi:hypothetical protein